MTAATQTTNGTPMTGAPACPKCGGRMWDNRENKRNPRAPDFKCRDRSCDGVLWPGQHNAVMPVISRRRVQQDDGPDGTRAQADSGDAQKPRDNDTARVSLRRCYLDLTDYVLREVRPKYQDAGVPCTDATVAAIVATLFIATCRAEGA